MMKRWHIGVATLTGLGIATAFLLYQHRRRERMIRESIPRDAQTLLNLGAGKACFDAGDERTIIHMDVVDKGTCHTPILFDGHTIPLPDNSVDCVLLAFVLHHVKHFRALMKEVRRVTKRYVVLAEDMPASSWERFFTGLHSGSDWGSCEECFLTHDEWLAAWRAEGFRVRSDIPLPRVMASDRPWLYPVTRRCITLEM
jgi:SAM-dependent methyltransferase